MVVRADVRRGETPDAALVERLRAGDRDAFVVLLERHRPVVRGVCRRLIGASPSVDDVIQESVVEALVRIDSLRDPTRFGPWLCGIAVNVTRRWLRAASREYASDVELADEVPGPEDVVLERELAELIRAALHELPDGQRAAVWLFYMRDYSVAETAATLHTTPGAMCVDRTFSTETHPWIRSTMKRRIRWGLFRAFSGHGCTTGSTGRRRGRDWLMSDAA
jgi:RNA polymerase sigma-70 factor (ECF subfamily)